MRFYIDPGTGSMLFAILIGIVGALNYVIKMGIVKIKFILSGGKKQEKNENKIPFVIFSDNKRYWTIFEPIIKEFNRRNISVTYMTMSKDDQALSSNYDCMKAEFIGEGNMAFSKLNFLDASVVLSTTPGLDVYQWKRSKNVDLYVHTFHAAGDVTLYRMFGIDYYDAILTQGKFQEEDIRKLEQMRDLPQKELCLVGIPYMDEMKKRVLNAGKVKNDIPIVLLAPSWGESAIFSKYKGQIIDELLKTGYHIIVRPHPQSFDSEKELMDELMNKYPNSDRLEWNRDTDNFDVLRKADILISDFSAVTYEFSLVHNKPIIYTDAKIDKAPFDAWWLKEDTFAEKNLKKLGMELNSSNIKNLKEIIDLCLNSKDFEKNREEVINDAWEYQGQAAERTVDFLLEKYKEIEERKGEDK